MVQFTQVYLYIITQIIFYHKSSLFSIGKQHKNHKKTKISGDLRRKQKKTAPEGAVELVEKIDFAHEVGFLNQFFATGFPGEKTLLSQQVCGLAAKPPRRARSWDVRRKSPFRGFFDGLTAPEGAVRFLDHCLKISFILSKKLVRRE